MNLEMKEEKMEKEKRREGHSALRVKDGELETFDPHPEKEIEEKWEKEANVETAMAKLPKGSFAYGCFRDGYLQACRKRYKERQEEIERLQKRIFDQAITISKLMPCATVDEEEEAK